MLRSTLCGCLLWLTFMANATDLNIYLAKNPNFVGDNDQLQGAGMALVQEFSQHHTQAKLIDIYESDLVLKPPAIALFSSSDGVASWHKLKAQNPQLFSVFLTHQWWESLVSALSEQPSFNLVVAPQYTLNSGLLNLAVHNRGSLLGINGVCSSLQRNSIETAFRQSALPKQTKFLLVLLAGDSQDTSGGWQLFSQENTRTLARVLIRQYQLNHFPILVTNGPRTGKIDPANGQITTAHRDQKLDRVSQTFLKELQKGVPESQIYFYNFMYNAPSALPELLGAVALNPGSVFYVPGDSISTASQGLSLLESQSLIIYQHHALLPSHEQFIRQQLQLGCAKVLTASGDLKLPAHAANSQCQVNPCQVVAETIVNLWSKPHK